MLEPQAQQETCELNLLTAEETLQQIHKTIFDKPERMGKYENAPRPDDT